MSEFELEQQRDYLEYRMTKSEDEAELEALSEKLDEVNDLLDDLVHPNWDDYDY